MTFSDVKLFLDPTKNLVHIEFLDYHFPLDGHWNPRGHELAARSLIEYFAKAQDHAGRAPDTGPVENR